MPEEGLPDFEIRSWFGLLVPTGTPVSPGTMNGITRLTVMLCRIARNVCSCATTKQATTSDAATDGGTA